MCKDTHQAWPWIPGLCFRIPRTYRKDLRKYESVSIEPIRILRVEAHEFIEKDVGNRRHAHRGSGMSGVGFEGSIDLGDRTEKMSAFDRHRYGLLPGQSG